MVVMISLPGMAILVMPSPKGGITRPGGRVIGVTASLPGLSQPSYRFKATHARHVSANLALASSRLAQNPYDGR